MRHVRRRDPLPLGQFCDGGVFARLEHPLPSERMGQRLDQRVVRPPRLRGVVRQLHLIPPTTLHATEFNIRRHPVCDSGLCDRSNRHTFFSVGPEVTPMNSVSIAFELMRIELEVETERLNAAGAAAFRSSDYALAREQTQRGENLQDFRERIAKLEEEWHRRFSPPETTTDVALSPPDPSEQVRTILSHSKSSKTGLLVRFKDGTVIAERTAAETFSKVLQRIGFDRVEQLGVLVNGENVVSSTKSQKYNDHFLAGRYIKTHSSTMQKVRNLQQISDALTISLEIQVVD